MEREQFEDSGLIAEIAGRKGEPMSENDAYYLHEYIDPMVDKLIADMDAEIKRRKESDLYQMRTIKEL